MVVAIAVASSLKRRHHDGYFRSAIYDGFIACYVLLCIAAIGKAIIILVNLVLGNEGEFTEVHSKVGYGRRLSLRTFVV